MTREMKQMHLAFMIAMAETRADSCCKRAIVFAIGLSLAWYLHMAPACVVILATLTVRDFVPALFHLWGVYDLRKEFDSL